MARPVALVANFSKTALSRILDEIKADPQPLIADWYIGTYRISKPDAIAAARFRHAPVLAIQPRTSSRVRERRRVRKAEAMLLDTPRRRGRALLG